MGRPRRKKGKSARLARQGQLGLSSSVLNKKRPKQFEKRIEHRLAIRDDRQTEELLRENIYGQKSKEEPKAPHSFIIHTKRVGKYINQLERDLRRVMSPYTSKALKVTKRNNFKDFVVNSQFLGVSHLLVLSRTPISVNFRIIRNPQGPTLHFRVEKYSLARDVLKIQKRPVIYEELFQHAPLVIMNGFGGETKRHLQLMQTVVQNMFPSIDVDRAKLATIRRALLLNYEPEEDIIEFRHYSIKAVPAGVSRSTKKILQNKIPDLSNYADISDFMLKPEQMSDSEFEGEQVELQLPQDFGGRGKKKGQQTKLRLMEIGPRMSLRMLKIEEGINEGEVLHHAYIEKTAKELAMLRKMAPLARKKRLRHEKQVEHMTIRKMKYQADKEAKQAEMDEGEKQRLISKQKEVTGDYSGDDDAEETVCGPDKAEEEDYATDDDENMGDDEEDAFKEEKNKPIADRFNQRKRQSMDGGKKPVKRNTIARQKTGSGVTKMKKSKQKGSRFK